VTKHRVSRKVTWLAHADLLRNHLESSVRAREYNDAAELRQKAEVVYRSLIAPGIFEGQRQFET